MKRPFLSAGLIVLSLGLAGTGCSQTGSKGTTSSTSKPGDPTSWSERDVSNDNSSSSTSLPKSSRLSGGWSSEAQEIERSMGVGK